MGDLLILELKASVNLESYPLAQAKNYIVAYNFNVGLLINFGATSLQFKKIYNPNNKKIQNRIE
ncbi:MAG: GxxExxY protein [Pedobacter terrae]